MTTPEIANHSFVRPTKSIRQRTGFAVAPMKAALLNQLEAAEDAEHGARRGDGREHRDEHAEAEQEGEARGRSAWRRRTAPPP